MASDLFICSCTARKVSVSTSSCRNVLIRAWRVAQRERREPLESPLGILSGAWLVAVVERLGTVSVIAETAEE